MADIDLQKVDQATKDKYQIADNTFSAVVKDVPKELLEVEVGDSKQVDFYPQLKIKNWNNETNLSIRLKDEDPSPAEVIAESDKIKWRKSNIEANYYNIPKVNKLPDFIDNVDYKQVRHISLGGISAKDLPAVHKIPEGSDTPVMLTYWMNEDALGFYGKNNANINIGDIDDLKIPITRFPTTRDTNCPVSLIKKDATIAIDLYYPNAKDKNEEHLIVFENAIKSVLNKYGISVFRKDEKLFQHVLFYEIDGILKQLGRMTWDNHNLICYLYLDSPLTNEILENVKSKIVFQDKTLLPIGGMREVNQNINLEIVDEIAEKIEKLFKFKVNKDELTQEELGLIEILKKKYNNKKFLEDAQEDEGKNREEGVDSYEFDIILKEKPVSNVLEFTIETKGLDFFYQPELTKEEKIAGQNREDYVVGSYAVYHKEKQGNYSAVGGNNYQTGKVFHIYRPKVTDSDGNWVWAELNIDTENKLLNITTPQDFLDKAVYPITIDPTFGFTTAGASTENSTANMFYGSLFTSGAASKVDGIVVACNRSATRKHALYLNSDSSLVAQSAASTVATDTQAAPYWSSIRLARENITASTDYIIGQGIGSLEKGDQSARYYDTGSTNQGHSASIASYPTLDNPETFTHSTNKYSAYCCYSDDGFPIIESTGKYSDQAASTSHTLTMPSGIASGDLLLAFITVSDGVTVTWPAGWTQLYGYTGAIDPGVAVGYKVAAGSDTCVIGLASSEPMSAIIHRISGAGTPEEAHATGIDPPSLTPSGGSKKYLWIAALGQFSVFYPPTPPDGYAFWTRAVYGTNNNDDSGALYTVEYRNEASSENPGTFGTGSGSYSKVFTVAVPPASGGSSSSSSSSSSSLSSSSSSSSSSSQSSSSSSSSLSSSSSSSSSSRSSSSSSSSLSSSSSSSSRSSSSSSSSLSSSSSSSSLSSSSSSSSLSSSSSSSSLSSSSSSSSLSSSSSSSSLSSSSSSSSLSSSSSSSSLSSSSSSSSLSSSSSSSSLSSSSSSSSSSSLSSSSSSSSLSSSSSSSSRSSSSSSSSLSSSSSSSSSSLSSSSSSSSLSSSSSSSSRSSSSSSSSLSSSSSSSSSSLSSSSSSSSLSSSSSSSSSQSGSFSSSSSSSSKSSSSSSSSSSSLSSSSSSSSSSLSSSSSSSSSSLSSSSSSSSLSSSSSSSSLSSSSSSSSLSSSSSSSSSSLSSSSSSSSSYSSSSSSSNSATPYDAILMRYDKTSLTWKKSKLMENTTDNLPLKAWHSGGEITIDISG